MEKKKILIASLIALVIFAGAAGNLYSQERSVRQTWTEDGMVIFTICIGSNENFTRQLNMARQLLSQRTPITENAFNRFINNTGYEATSYRGESISDLNEFKDFDRYTMVIVYVNESSNGIIGIVIDEITPINRPQNVSDRRYNTNMRVYM